MLVVDPKSARVLREMFEPIDPNQTYSFKGLF